MYDVIIIGGGPAGLTAAIYAARSGLKTMLIEQMFSGGQMTSTYEIENYPGIKSVDGPTLSMQMDEQARACGAALVTANVTSMELTVTPKIIHTDSGDHETKTVILATGASRRKLGVDGEVRLTGMGVSYCATCDGGFYRKKTVAVVGGGDVALEDAIYLANLAETVYLIHRRDSFRASNVLVEKMRQCKNVVTLMDTVTDEIVGDTSVSQLKIHNVKTNEVRTLDVNGVFVAVGNQPNTALFAHEISLDNNGYVDAGEDCRTNIPGVFAAGDLRRKPLYQIVTAAADGAVAAKMAFEAVHF